MSAMCWEEDGAFPAIPIILLLLAAMASSRGAHTAARSGATLAWVVLPVLGIVSIAGTRNINVSWVQQPWRLPDGALIAVLLCPCASLFLPCEERKADRWIAVVPACLTAAASILLNAAMGTSTGTAGKEFYEFSKSVDLFGVAERFEALVASALTVSWFALFALMLSVVYHLTERIISGDGKWGVWLATAASIMCMCFLHSSAVWLAFGGAIFWGFVPIVAQEIERQKMLKKVKITLDKRGRK